MNDLENEIRDPFDWTWTEPLYNEDLTPGDDIEILELMDELREEIYLQTEQEDWIENSAGSVIESMEFATINE